MPKLTKRTKLVCIVTGCLPALFALGWVGMRLLVSDVCGNEIISQILSPDKNLKAILFRRDCGATTAFSYQVSVLNPWDSLSDADSGNVFVSYGSPSIRWKDSRTLVITRTTAETIFHDQKEVTVWPLFKKVSIEYPDQ